MNRSNLAAAMVAATGVQAEATPPRKCGIKGCFQLKLHGCGVCRQHADEIDAAFVDETAKPQLTLVPPVRDTLPCPAPAEPVRKFCATPGCGTEIEQRFTFCRDHYRKHLGIDRRPQSWAHPCEKCGAPLPATYAGTLCRECRDKSRTRQSEPPASSARPVAAKEDHEQVAPKVVEATTVAETVTQPEAQPAPVVCEVVKPESKPTRTPQETKAWLFKLWRDDQLQYTDSLLHQADAFVLEGERVTVGKIGFPNPRFQIRYMGDNYEMFSADRAERIKNERRALDNATKDRAAEARAEKERERAAAEAKRTKAAEAANEAPRRGKSSGDNGKGKGGKSSGNGKGGKRK